MNAFKCIFDRWVPPSMNKFILLQQGRPLAARRDLLFGSFLFLVARFAPLLLPDGAHFAASPSGLLSTTYSGRGGRGLALPAQARRGVSSI